MCFESQNRFAVLRSWFFLSWIFIFGDDRRGKRSEESINSNPNVCYACVLSRGRADCLGNDCFKLAVEKEKQAPSSITTNNRLHW